MASDVAPVLGKRKEKAIVLLSGGLDSTTVLAMASDELGPENIIALSLLYGQKHDKEIQAAKDIVAYFGVMHIIHQMPDLFAGGESTLMKGGPANPRGSYQDIAPDVDQVSPTYVPFRNGNLLSAAAALALKYGCSQIHYGAHAEDARNWAYPDCTPEFNGAMANAIYVGTYHKVRLITPLQNMTKAQIIRAAQEFDAPLSLTWSCYEGKAVPCGECPTCVGRIKAFMHVGYIDPVPYAIGIDWSGCDAWEGV